MTTPERPRRRVRAIAAAVLAQPVDAAFVCLVIVGCLFIFYLGRSSTFRGDDWVFIGERPPYALDYLMVPHNEHWSFFMKLVFQVLFSFVGMRSYLPYLAVLLVAQAAAVIAVYAAVSAAGGRILAFSVGSVMLFLGSAHENLFWYAGLGVLLSLATGATATWLVLARPTSTRVSLAVGGLLVLSVMSSGCGLAFIAGLAVAMLLDPTRRSGWWGPVGAGLVYLGWYAIWGRSAVSGVTVDSIIGTPAFVFTGATNAFGAATGLGPDIGGVAVVVMVGAVWVGIATGRRPPFAATAGTVGLLTFLGITGLVRVEGPLGTDMAYAPRYITTSAALLVIALAGLLGRPTDRTAATLRAFALAPLLVVALVSNGSALIAAAAVYSADATELRAELVLWDQYQDAPAVRDSNPLHLPQLRTLLAEYGSPVRDEIRPTVVLPITADVLDRALFQLVGDQMTVAPGSTGGETLIPSVVGQYETTIQTTSSCLQAQALGPDAQVWLSVPSGGSLRLVTDGWGDVGIFLAHDYAFQEAAAIHKTIVAQTPYRITVPDMGPGFAWRVAIKLGVGIRSASICSLAEPAS
jgi:hypothetical protein